MAILRFDMNGKPVELDVDDSFMTKTREEQQADIEQIEYDMTPNVFERFRAPIGAGIEGVGKTLEVLGLGGSETVGDIGKGITGEGNRAADPNNPQAQTNWEQVVKDPMKNALGYAAQVAGGAAQPLVTAAVGGSAGFAMGGPPGALIGAIGAPAASTFVSTLGPVVEEIAGRAGRSGKPTSEDWAQALATSGGLAAIDGIAGKMGISSGVVKNLIIGAFAGATGSAVHQAGTTGTVDGRKVLDATVDSAAGFGIVSGGMKVPAAIRSTAQTAGKFRAGRDYSDNPEQVTSDLRVAETFDAAKRTSDKFDAGHDVPADVQFKRIQDDLKGELKTLSDRLYDAGAVDKIGHKELNDVLSQAAKHNRDLGQDGADTGYFPAEIDRVKALGLPKNIEATFLKTLRDLNTITFNSKKLNKSGPLERLAGVAGPLAGGVIGSTVGMGVPGLGVLAGGMVGAAASKSMKGGARLIDKALGLQRPPIIARAASRRRMFDAKKIDPGNTVRDLQAAIAETGTRAKLVVPIAKEANLSKPDLILRAEGVQRGGGWMRTIQEKANEQLPPDKRINQRHIEETINHLRDVGALNDKHVASLLGDRSGRISDDRVFYAIQDMAVHRAGGLDQVGVIKNAGSDNAKSADDSGIRNPEAYTQTMKNVEAATKVALQKAPSLLLKAKVAELANTRSKAEKSEMLEALIKASPKDAAYLNDYVRPLTEFGPRASKSDGLSEDAGRVTLHLTHQELLGRIKVASSDYKARQAAWQTKSDKRNKPFMDKWLADAEKDQGSLKRGETFDALKSRTGRVQTPEEKATYDKWANTPAQPDAPEPSRSRTMRSGIDPKDVNDLLIKPAINLGKKALAKLQSKTLKPLEGLPTSAKIKGQPDVEAGPSAVARNVAKEYMKSAGLKYNPPKKYVKADKDRAERIAKAYDEMKHDPSDPLVKAAWKALGTETMAQWAKIKATGLKVEFIDFEKQGDPYAASPRLAIEDITKNNHFYVFKTDDGFGTEGITKSAVNDNPMMEQSGEKFSGHPARMNDIFRVVHDYFGHAKEGVGFRAHGEENAWVNHSAMFSDLARIAATAETRGQNSWVNYGPHGEKNRTASGADTVFAEQKVGILPDWVYSEGADGLKPINIAAMRKGLTPKAKASPGKFSTTTVRDDGLVELTHYGLDAGMTKTDPSKWGRNSQALPRSERNRIGDAPGRTYFGMNEGKPGGYVKESGLGNNKYHAYVKPKDIYDADTDNLGLRKEDGPASQIMKDRGFDSRKAFDIAVKEAGFKGYWNKSEIGTVAQMFEPLAVSGKAQNDTPKAKVSPSKFITAPKGGDHAIRSSVDLLKSTTAPIGKGIPDVAAYLHKQFGKPLKDGEKFKLEYNEKTFANLKKAMSQETDHQLATDKSPVNWYDSDTMEALRVSESVVPELKDNVPLQFLTTTFAALHSGGQMPVGAWQQALDSTGAYVKTGKVQPLQSGGKKWGIRSATINEPKLASVGALVDHLGTGGFMKFMTTQHSVGEIVSLMEDVGHPMSDGVVKDLMFHTGPTGDGNGMVFGARFLGNKMGPFNLNVAGPLIKGVGDNLYTSDLWEARGFNRLIGAPLMKDANGDFVYKSDPRTENERLFQQRAKREIAAERGLTAKQAQALGWVYEQNLYTTLGASSKSTTHSDGAKVAYEKTFGRKYREDDDGGSAVRSDAPLVRKAGKGAPGILQGADANGGRASQKVPSALRALKIDPKQFGPDSASMKFTSLENDKTVFWHGSPSGDLRGGAYGLHLGTKRAAEQALFSRIGVPADGKGWDGGREYGKTLLAGKSRLKQLGVDETGFNGRPPDDDFYPKHAAKYSDGSLVQLDAKPSILPYRIKGDMVQGTMGDSRANGVMKANIKKGTARKGYFYRNDGEDAGSTSVVVPSKDHITPA